MSTQQGSDDLSTEFKQTVEQATEEDLMQIISDWNERWFWYWHEHDMCEDDYIRVLDDMILHRDYAEMILREKYDHHVKFIDLLSNKARARWARLDVMRLSPLYELTEGGNEVLEQFDPGGEEEIERINTKKEEVRQAYYRELEEAQRQEIRQAKLKKAGKFLKKHEKKEKMSGVDSILNRLTESGS